MPWRYHARPHAIGAWVCTPVERLQPPPPGPGLVEEQPQDDGRVAMMDPSIGLIGMQVLPFCHMQKHKQEEEGEFICDACTIMLA